MSKAFDALIETRNERERIGGQINRWSFKISDLGRGLNQNPEGTFVDEANYPTIAQLVEYTEQYRQLLGQERELYNQLTDKERNQVIPPPQKRE